MSWKAYLRGDALDLRILRGLFRNGDVVVSENENGTFLSASRLDDIADVSDRHREAERLLTSMNGIARALNDSLRPVELVGRYEDESGHVTQIIGAETVMIRSHIEAAGVVVSGGADSPSPDPPPAAPRFLSLAISNPNVAEAVGLIGKPGDLNWVNLYKLYEIVVTDVGGGQAGLIKTGWITRATLSTFTASANHPSAGGSDARHARLPGKAPRSTMTLEEARALITRLVNDWMGSLV